MIDILLATYNGEKYIKNQILSIISQTYQKWNLIIHDDGSTDNTIKIIKELAEIDNRIFLIDDKIICGGAGKNFLHLIRYSKSNFTIFCDQDDIWLETKLEELLRKIMEVDNPEIPVLVYCDGYPWDSNGNIKQESISTNHAESLKDFIFFNSGYQGCSIMMNKKLIMMAKNYTGYVYHHDDLVSLLAHSFGKVYFLPKKLMLYRQHDAAVTGNKSFNNNKISKLWSNSGFLLSREHFNVKKNFYTLFKNDLSNNNRLIFEKYLKFSGIKNIFFKVYFILFSNLTWGGSKSKLILKIIFQRMFDK